MLNKKKVGQFNHFLEFLRLLNCTLEWLLICNRTFTQKESKMKGLAFIKFRFLTFTSFFENYFLLLSVSIVIFHYKTAILNWDTYVFCTNGTRKGWSAHKNSKRNFQKNVYKGHKRHSIDIKSLFSNSEGKVLSVKVLL